MTKYQENRFKGFIECLEYLYEDYGMSDDIKYKVKLLKEGRELKTNFYKWFLRQLELEKLKTIRNLAKKKPKGIILKV